MNQNITDAIIHLHSIEPEERCRAADYLAQSQDAFAIDALMRRFTLEEHPEVMAAIIDAFLQIKSTRAIKPLLDAYERFGQTSLGKTIQTAIDILQQQLIEELIDQARNQRYTPTTRERAFDKLIMADATAAFSVAIDALTDPLAGIRCIALGTLQELGDVRAITTIVPLLHDSDGDVRFDAAKSLAGLGDKRGYMYCLVTLRHPDALERLGALNCLSAIWREGDSSRPFIEALTDSHPEVRTAAIIYLSSIAGMEAAVYFLRALCDENEDVQIAAAMELETVYDAPFREIIRKEVNATDPAIRQAAQNARHYLSL